MAFRDLKEPNQQELFCKNITPKSVNFNITWYGCISPILGTGTATRVGNLCFIRFHRIYEIHETGVGGLYFDTGTIPLGYRPNVDNDAQGYPVFLFTQETDVGTSTDVRYQSLGILLPDGSGMFGRGLQLEPYNGVGYDLYIASTLINYPCIELL